METVRRQTLLPIAVYTVAIVPHTVDTEIKEDMALVLNIDMWFVQPILHIVIVIVIFGIDGENLIEI